MSEIVNELPVPTTCEGKERARRIKAADTAKEEFSKRYCTKIKNRIDELEKVVQPESSQASELSTLRDTPDSVALSYWRLVYDELSCNSINSAPRQVS